jgi:hypothetical protein
MAAKGVWSGDSVADHESTSTTLHRVAGFNRNGWPASVGIDGRLASESVAGLHRNTQPEDQTRGGGVADGGAPI